MARLEIRPFSDEFVAAAGELLAERHRAHRARRAAPAAAVRGRRGRGRGGRGARAGRGASGAVALRDGRVVGYLLGAPRRDDAWGANVWVELAGHAVEEAEDLRDLYAAAAERWVEEGRAAALRARARDDRALVEAWCARRLRAAARARDPRGARDRTGRTARASRRRATSTRSSSWRRCSSTTRRGRRSSRAAPHAESTGRAARRDPRGPRQAGDRRPRRSSATADIVGAFQIVPVELSSVHSGLARPPGAALLGWAATDPAVRGSGAGARADARPRSPGRASAATTIIVTDWRVTNLLASRFWPSARLPGRRSSALPPHPVVPRIPIPSGSRVAVVNAPEDAVVLRPPPPSRGDRRRRRGGPRRAPLPALGLAARGARHAAAARRRSSSSRPSCRCPARPTTLGGGARRDDRASSSGSASRRERQTILVAGGLNRRAGQRELEALLDPPSRARASAAGSRCTTPRRPTSSHLGDAGRTPLRVNRLARRDRPRRLRHGRRDRPARRPGGARSARCGAETLARSDRRYSLLETAASRGWQLGLALERSARGARAGDRRVARPQPAAAAPAASAATRTRTPRSSTSRARRCAASRSCRAGCAAGCCRASAAS